jgi:hypothetical protein
MNSVSEEVFFTKIKRKYKRIPKQTRTTQENIIISKPTLTSTTLETKTIVSESNTTPKVTKKEIIITDKNLLLYIVFGIFVVSLLIIFILLFVIYLNSRRKRYKRIITYFN